MNLYDVYKVLKGGPGSGDWGHVGRAGKRGGSGGGGGKRRSRPKVVKGTHISNPINFSEYGSYLTNSGKFPGLTVGLFDRRTGDLHISSSNTSHTMLSRNITDNVKDAGKLEDSAFHITFGLSDNKVDEVFYDVSQAGKSRKRLGIGGLDDDQIIDAIFKNMNKLNKLGLEDSTKVTITRLDGSSFDTTLKSVRGW